ncbi:MAG: ATP-binding protein [Campylobacterota bacterium]|nr:ATP-binding protein [Campylobacterota bacterium]
MEKVIIAQNRHWKQPYAGLYQRDIFQKLERNLATKHIQVIQGIRRSGKSTLFRLLINHLCLEYDAHEILYINLDDPFFTPYRNDATKLYEIVQVAKKLTQKEVKYLFLDEVQNIKGWESYVKSVYDSELYKKIFVTGSNSTLLEGELATLLSGRYLSVEVHPLSFKEILRINQITSPIELIESQPKVLKLLDDMMIYGSFVEVYEHDEELRRDILSNYYQSILLKDCVANHALRDVKSFKELSFYLLSNITSLYSYSSLGKIVGINDKSAKEYLGYLEQSYLCSELKQFSFSLKEQQNAKKKIYFNDNGFILLSFKFSANYGKLLENLVLNELIKAGYSTYFYNKNFECDFIAQKESETIAIQVCYDLNDTNQKREVNGLKKLPFNVDRKILITYNQRQSIEDIEVISFWEFFA